MKHIIKWIWLLIFFNTAFYAQEEIIPFYKTSLNENVDYHSFSPAMMLKHTIGKTFTKLPKNPVLKPTRKSWDSKDVADPFVMVTADSIMLFYDGDDRDSYHIGYAARSKDGWTWKKRGKFLEGSGKHWDSFHQIAPIVFPTKFGWQIFYNGQWEDEEIGYQWGVASGALDQLSYSSNLPLMPLDTLAWDGSGNAYGDILYFPEAQKYKMWYSGFQGPIASIGLAESQDGKRWKKITNGPILTGLPGVIAPDVIFNGESYTMFYVQSSLGKRGLRTTIYRAKSQDGIKWGSGTEVLRSSKRWEGKRLMRPNISYFEGRLWLYYCGGRGGKWKIGAAYTYPEFVPNGKWRSAKMILRKNTLVIKYEQPESTLLQIKWTSSNTQTAVDIPVAKTDELLRKGVYKAIWTIPANLLGKTGHLEISFGTTDPKKSPVMHQISQKSLTD